MLVRVSHLVVLVLCTNCGQAQQPPARPSPPALTEVEVDAANYVDQSTRLRFPYRLNLADDRQYAYVMAMLRLAGDSPQQSPQLYKNLADGHANGKPGPPELAMGEGTTTVEGGLTTTVTPINIIQYIYDNGTTATSSLLSSVQGGTDNTTMMVNYRISGQARPFAFSPLYKQSGGGKQFMQNFSANLPNSSNAAVVASSLILTSRGGTTTPYTMTLDDATPNATSVCSTAPNYGVRQSPPINCPAVGANCVNQGSITNPIVSCYGRNTGPGTDCNYIWGGSGYPPSMTLNIAGSMTFPNPVDPSLSGTYLLNLQRSDGGCFLPPGGGEPSALTPANFSISNTNPNVLNFCFSGASFPNSGCLSTVTANVFLSLSVFVTLDVAQGPNIGMGMISSNSAVNPNQPWFAQVPVITVMQGCFAPGTEITLADGTTRKVERFTGDGTESVLLDRDGAKGLIKSTGEGTESKPLLRITDSAGHSLVVTETHAIMTGKGPKMAWQVGVGDTLYTREGTSRVTKIEAVPAVPNQKVHNLFIGDAAQAAAGKTTMFANGILVGDMFMQNEIFKRSQEQGFSRAEVLSRLPDEWQRDYLNSLENGTERK